MVNLRKIPMDFYRHHLDLFKLSATAFTYSIFALFPTKQILTTPKPFIHIILPLIIHTLLRPIVPFPHILIVPSDLLALLLVAVLSLAQYLRLSSANILFTFLAAWSLVRRAVAAFAFLGGSSACAFANIGWGWAWVFFVRGNTGGRLILWVLALGRAGTRTVILRCEATLIEGDG